MSLSSGSRLGPYEILSLIGAGGMGEVYRARDPRIGREVAIKILPAAYAHDSERLRRFEQEVRSVGSLNHPNILTIYDFGSEDGSSYLVSELLTGETLRDRIRSGIPQRRAVELGQQIATGLAAAHEKGIVHRDLKPENLFVTNDEQIKILDFGLAKLREPETKGHVSVLPTSPGPTEPGVVLGTVGYMSPEQVRGFPADHRSDIFSLGCVLYELLTSKRAFYGDSSVETMNAILKEDPTEYLETNANLSPALIRIVNHCLEKKPESRFQSARDLAFDLQMISGSFQSTKTSAPAALSLRKRIVRYSAAVLAFIAALATGILIGARNLPHTTGQAVSTPQPVFQRLTFRRGYVASARFAPDGHAIVYGAAFGGNPTELFSTHLERPESRSLGLPSAKVLSISRSSDMAILLNPHFTSGWMTSGTLAEVPIDGGTPREILSEVEDAQWSPNRNDLMVVRAAPKYSIEFPIGRTLYQTDGWISDARFSPSGEQIAFVDHPTPGDNRGSIASMDLNGRITMLTNELSSVSGLGWSPNGQEILFTGRHPGPTLNAVSLTRKQRLIFQFPIFIVLHDVSKEGDVLISLEDRRRQISGLPPGATKELDLSWFEYSISDDLSNDGKTLLFNEGGATAGFQYPVYTRKTDGSPPVRLGEGLPLALSPDGRWALAGLFGNPYKLTLLPTGMGRAKVLDVPGVELRPQSHLWFSDGKSLLIAGSQSNRPARFWIYDLERATSHPVTPEGVETIAMISPDQERVLACCKDHIFSFYSLANGNAIPVPTLTEEDTPLQWNADRKSVYVSQGFTSPIKIFLIDLQSGRRSLWKEIAPADPVGVHGVDSIHITPDGKAYVYSYRRVLSDLFLVKGIK